MKQWMQGPLASFVEEGLRETIERQLLPEVFVNELRANFQGDRLHWTRLWAVVVLGQYAKRHQLICAPDENSSIQSHG
jgi:hypothetical protein